MSINKMTTFSTLAAVYRRASSVVFTTPADGTTPFVRFVEEDVISDAEGTRYSPAGTALCLLTLMSLTILVLFCMTRRESVNENLEFNETTVADLMAMDNNRTIDLPVKGELN